MNPRRACRHNVLHHQTGETGKVMTCDQCRETIPDDEGREFHSEMLCDDCYIDRIFPKVLKTSYPNDAAEFMRRLQVSYSLHPQRYS